jgi:hypothetical protein
MVKHHASTSRWTLALFLTVVLGGYIGGYLCLVRRSATFVTGRGPWSDHVWYGIGGPAADCGFAPIHALDRRLRNDDWTFDLGDFRDNTIEPIRMVPPK